MQRKQLSQLADEVKRQGEPQDVKAAKQDASKKATGRPERAERAVKVTVYLDPDANDALEEAWYRLRRRSGQKLSKSAIASAALRLASEDLDRLLGDVRLE